MVNWWRHLKYVALVLAVGAVAGCAHMPAGIAASSTPLEGRPYTVVGHAKQTDSRIMLLGVLPVSGSNNTREALNGAIRSRNGDALINITVEYVWHFWILWASDITVVEGDVIKFDAQK